jgi:hypothetical protein
MIFFFLRLHTAFHIQLLIKCRHEYMDDITPTSRVPLVGVVFGTKSLKIYIFGFLKLSRLSSIIFIYF